MRTAGVAGLKAKLSKYLEAVKAGEEVIVTEHGKAIARVVPYTRSGATPASMSAPSIAEMREYRPHPPDSLNLVPVMQWLTEKLSGKKKDD